MVPHGAIEELGDFACAHEEVLHDSGGRRKLSQVQSWPYGNCMPLWEQSRNELGQWPPTCLEKARKDSQTTTWRFEVSSGTVPTANEAVA